MKKLFVTLFAALAILACSCGGDEPKINNDNTGTENPDTPDKPDTPDTPDVPVTPDEPDSTIIDSRMASLKVRDLALIYQGGKHRIDWTEDQFEPYVTHKFADGSEKWIFDGYLFIEFWDGGEYQFSPGYNKKNATKAVWQWYLDRIFEQDKSLDALDKMIAKKKRRLGNPGFRHKIALTAVVPIIGTSWGDLNGRWLNFSNADDRRDAVKWFIDELYNRFKSRRYNNIDLYAIYWIAENTYFGLNETITNDVKSIIDTKGLDFIWIPYFGAEGAPKWKTLGFDLAYYQPNYFFSDNIEYSRLTTAINFAKKNEMGMEFECDEHALYQDAAGRQYRMKHYIDAFEEQGVFESMPIAYYTGNHMFIDMVENPHEKNQEIMDRLCGFIVDRRKRAIGK